MSASAERSEGTNPETGNHWTGTDRASKQRLEFSGIVIWRIVDRQIMERWAYLESPGFVRS